MARDVELVIRARDAATKAIDSIKDALNELTGVQEDVGKSAAKTDTLLGELGRQLNTLNAEAKGMAALGKVAAEIDKAGASVSKLEGDVRKSAAEFAKLARETENAGRNAGQLRGQLEAERKSLAETTKERSEANAALREANAEVKKAEANQNAYNRALEKSPARRSTKGVGTDVGTPNTSARDSYAVFAAAGVAQANAAQSQLQASVAAFDTQIEKTRASVAVLETQVGSAAEQERKLSRETEKVSASLSKSRADLVEGRTALQGITTSAETASTAFTGMALDQDKVAAASNRMAAEIARTKARIDALNQSSKTPVTGTGDRRAVLESRRDFVAAQAEVKRLADEMRGAAGPSAELGAALGKAQAAARSAAEAYEANRLAASRLKAEQGSLASFLQRTASEQQKAATAFVSGQASIARGGQAITATAGTTAAALPPIAAAAQEVDRGLRQVAQGGGSFRDVMKALSAEGRQSLSFLQRMRGELLSLTSSFIGLYGAANQLGAVVNAFSTLETAQARLNVAFGGDKGEVSQELDFIGRQAQRLGIQFGQLSEQYSKFAVAANAANFTSEATRKVFLSVAEAGRVNRLSADQLNGVFLALTQMISKGKVSAEELRGQLGERLTGAFNIFANAIGVSTAELDKMLEKGQVIANERTFLKFADELDKRFGPTLAEAIRGTSAELGRFSDNIFQAQARVAEGGFIDGFTKGLESLNAYFQSREGRDFFLSLGDSLGTLAQGLAQIPRYFGEIGTAISVIIGLKLASYFTNVVQSVNNVRGAMSAANASLFTWQGTITAFNTQLRSFGGGITSAVDGVALMGAGTGTAARSAGVLSTALTGLRGIAVAVAGSFRILYAAMGGLPGLVLTGVTIALGQWITKTDEATSALDEHKRQMQEVIGAYETAKGKVDNWAGAVKNLTLTQAQDNLSKLIDAYDAKLRALGDRASGVRGQLATLQGPLGQITRERMDPALLRDLEGIGGSLDALGTRSITLVEFRRRLDEIGQTTGRTDIKALVADLLNFLDTSKDGEDSLVDLGDAIEKSEARVRLLQGAATDADKALLGLKDAVDATGDSLAQRQQDADAFTKALQEIQKTIPGISDEMDRLGKIDALEKQYQAAVKLARTMSEVNALTNAYNSAVEGINAESLEKVVTGGGSSGNIVDKIIGIESGGNATIKNPNSTATGAGQFIESTFLRMFKQYFPATADGMGDRAILELRKNADISRKLVEAYARENAQVLQKAGLAVNDATIYLAHFLGPGGATKLLSASGGTQTSQILGADQINANKSILQGKTAQEVYDWAVKKVGISKQDAELGRQIAETDQKRAEKAADYNTELDNRLSLQAQENANGGRLTREATIQKAIAEERKRADEAGVVLSAERIAQITELTGKEYDLANAKREGKTADQEANVALQQATALASQRNELQKQFNLASKSGDLTTATELQTQLADTNLKLQEAIDKARAMWQAIGGPEADVALTKLDTLQLKAQATTNSLGMFGLSTQQVGQLAGSFADGLVGVFDSFAQAVANGEDAVQALGQAFLQFAANFLREIATMILKQLVLNALQKVLGFSLPGVGAAHTGGVVGSVGTGMGNMRKSVSPAIFAGAMRYHGGGVAGLAPDEVPAILKQGEEVLTENDPRHRANGGLGQDSGGGGGMPPIRQVLVMDEESALNHLNSPAGERVIVSYISKNRATIKRMLG